jgi:hypothetical protein
MQILFLSPKNVNNSSISAAFTFWASGQSAMFLRVYYSKRRSWIMNFQMPSNLSQIATIQTVVQPYFGGSFLGN